MQALRQERLRVCAKIRWHFGAQIEVRFVRSETVKNREIVEPITRILGLSIGYRMPEDEMYRCDLHSYRDP